MAADPIVPSGPTRAETVLQTLSDKLAVTARASNVYGEPVHAFDRTIVPVAKVGYGFGASSGGQDGDKVGGGGGGGAVGAKPAGYIEITLEGTRFVAFSTVPKIVAAALAGLTAGYMLARIRR
jgi:uncharacterized spore protein YtfJ